MNSEIVNDIVAIVDEVSDVEETCRPFGKRWLSQHVKLSSAHIAALQDGKLLAVDVNNEYVVFLEIDQRTPGDWKQYAGSLKDSPNLNGDPLTIQQDMRHERD